MPCASKRPKRSCITHTFFSQDSSDDDSTVVPLRSSILIIHKAPIANCTVRDQKSVDFLRSDEKIKKGPETAAKVASCQHTSVPQKTWNSGLHRVGNNAIKQEIT